MIERRRTPRIFLRVPINVQGIDQKGQLFSEETATVEINRDGARLGLTHTPRLGAEVRITNLTTGFTALFRVSIKCPQSYDGKPEWGVAVSAPLPDLMSDFWGVAFEETREEAPSALAGLLECGACQRRELVGLTAQEYQVLRDRESLPRVCTRCRKVTDWQVVKPHLKKTVKPAAKQTEVVPISDGAQRRETRRLALKVPLLVKHSSGASEVTESVDVSKTGLRFTTSLDLAVGDEVEVTIGHGVSQAPRIQTAQVIWRRPVEKGTRALIGVKLIEDALAAPSPAEKETPPEEPAAS